jgi:5-methylcytosine-specific restriction endonuclease McrA
VDAWRLASDAAFLRHKVYQRDKGKCAICFIQTDQIRDGLQALDRMTSTDWRDHGGRGNLTDVVQPLKMLRQALKIWMTGRTDFWDADHKVEVVRGGGECGLDNMQTLCIWCHKAKTARLAKERAEERRLQAEKTDGQQRFA